MVLLRNKSKSSFCFGVAQVFLLLKLGESGSGGKLFRIHSHPAKQQHIITVDVEDQVEDKQEFKDMFELRVAEPEPHLLVLQANSRREKALLMESLGIKDDCTIGQKATREQQQELMGRTISSVSNRSGETADSHLPLASTTLKRKPSKKIEALITKFEQGSREDLAAGVPSIQWPLTEKQMGLAGNTFVFFSNLFFFFGCFLRLIPFPSSSL